MTEHRPGSTHVTGRPLHLLPIAESEITWCGLTPPPFPQARATWPPESLSEHARVRLLDPDTCPACVDGYYSNA
jgi:hypothetical protein